MAMLTTAPRTKIDRFLDLIEYVGNKLPHPASLFLMLAGGVVILSGVLAAIGLSAVHPGLGRRSRS